MFIATYLTKYWRIMRRIDVWELVLFTVAHYFLFWWALIMTEASDAKVIEAVNFWYYWATTVLTVGYGDLSPASTGGRFLTPFFQFSGIAILTIAVTKVGSMVIEQFSKKRRGLMPTSAKNHVLILGDFNPVRISELLGNIVFDRKDDGANLEIVCCFRNTGDKNPFEGELSQFHGVTPEYLQAGSKGFGVKTLEAANAQHAHHIYVTTDDDTSAIGIIGALSRVVKTASVAVLLREKASAEMVPATNLDIRIILPVQAMLAVREMEDPGSGAAISELLDVENGESIYSLLLNTDAMILFGVAKEVFERLVGSKAILLGTARHEKGNWKPRLRPPMNHELGQGDRLVYIADQDLSEDEVKAINYNIRIRTPLGVAAE